jgi:U3 small nucleolar RNA-associated protein 24
MGKTKRVRKFAVMKKIVSPKDERVKLKEREKKEKQEQQKEEKKTEIINVPNVSSALFLSYNSALGPPYHVLIDTNFINFSIQNKIDIIEGMMNCLLAKCTAYITDCVLGELEKFGRKYRLALRLVKDPRFERLPCTHKGTYVDDCIVNRVTMHKCWIVATCDKDLKRRLRKIPGVPIMYVKTGRYSIERMPEAYGAPAF